MTCRRSAKNISVFACVSGLVSGLVIGFVAVPGVSVLDIFRFDEPIFLFLYELFPIAVIFFSGLSVLGFLFVYPAAFWKAYCVAFIYGAAFGSGVTDELKYVAMFLPAAIISVFSVLISSSEAFVFSLRIYRAENRKTLHADLISYFASFILYLLLAAVPVFYIYFVWK